MYQNKSITIIKFICACKYVGDWNKISYVWKACVETTVVD